MLGHQRKARILFELSDIVLAALAFEIAYWTRVALPLHFLFFLTSQQKVLVLGFSLFAWVVIGLWLEVYEKLDAGHPRTVLRDSVRQVALGGLCLLVFQYSLRMDLSRFFLGAYCGLAWVFLLLFRLTAGRLVGVIRREFAALHYVMIVGTGERALRLGRTLEHSAPYGVRLRGFFSESDAAGGGEITLEASHPVHALAELPSLLRQTVVDEIIFAVESRNLADLEEVFILCDQEGVRTRVAVDFFPHVNSTVTLERLDATPLLTFSAAPHDEVRLLVKRVLDILIATAGLLVLAPFMAVITILVRLTSPGPAIFSQIR